MSEERSVSIRLKAEIAGFVANIKTAARSTRGLIGDLDETARKQAELAALVNKKMRLDLDATKAKAEVAKLKAELAKLEATVALDADDTKAVAKIADVKAKLAAIADANVNVNVDTLAATAQIAALKEQLSDLGGTAGAVGGESTRSPLVALAGTLGSTVVPAAAAATVGIGAFASALVAAGGAGGVLGAAVTGQVVAMTKQQKIIATTTTALEALTKGTPEYAAKLKVLNAEQAEFTKTFGPAAKGLNDLKDAWAGFLAGTSKAVIPLIGTALEGVTALLPKLVPLANKASNAVSGLLDDFLKLTTGAQGKAVLDFFDTYGTKAITAFGTAALDLVKTVGNLVGAFAPLQGPMLRGLTDATAALARWSENLGSSSGFKSFVEYAMTNGPKLIRLLGNLGGIVVDLTKAFAPIGSVVLDVLNGLTRVLGKVTGFSTGLNTLALSVGSVALAMKGLGLSSAIGSMARFGLGTKAVAATADTAAVSATAMNTKLVALRGGAGVAGLGLTALGGKISQTNKTLGGLTTAAGYAAAGFAVGGPWGAAIGGGIGLLSMLGGSGNDAATAMAGLSDTLDKQTGAFTANSRAVVAKTLLDAGVLQMAKDAGVGVGALTTAVMKGGPALAGLNTQLDQTISAGKSVQSVGRGVSVVYTDQAKAAADLKTKVADQSAAVAQSSKEWRLLKTATAGTADTTALAVKTFVSSADVTRATTKALKGLISAQQTEASVLLAARTDRYALIAALNKEKAAVDDVTGGLDPNTKAGQRNNQMLTDAANQWNNSSEKVRNSLPLYKQQRDSFIDLAMQMGKTRDQAVEMTNKFLAVPTNITTKAGFNNAEAIRQLKKWGFDVTSLLKGIPDETVNVKLGTQASKVWRQLGGIVGTYGGGGPVNGPGTSTSDSVPARLSVGEHVLTADEVAKAGGHQVVFALRRAMREGLPGFAAGGVVGVRPSVTASGTASAVAEVTQRFVDAVASATNKLSVYADAKLSAMGSTGVLPGPNGRVSMDGEPLDKVTASQILLAEKLSGVNNTVMQGSWQAPSSYSGTSHTGAGVADVSPASFATQAWMRRVGFAAWARNIPGAATAGVGGHIHMVSLLDPAAASNAQAAAFRAGGDGLGGSDYGPNPPMIAGLGAQVAAIRARMYDAGGVLPPGYTLAYNGTGADEIVVSMAKGGPVTGLDTEQQKMARVIMAVGAKMAMTKRDIAVALMTALQESGLRNLNYGDRDSVGLFQQRPSAGWGTVAQIMQPSYAARKFFEALRGVPGYEALPMAQAAQAVQQSADGSLYAGHRDQALSIYKAMAGGAATPAATGAPVYDPVKARAAIARAFTRFGLGKRVDAARIRSESDTLISAIKDNLPKKSDLLAGVKNLADLVKATKGTVWNARAVKDLNASVRGSFTAFGIGRNATADKTRTEVSDLTKALKATLGADAPILDRVDSLGDKLTKAAKAQDRTTASLQALRSARRSYSSSVAGTFANDIFGGGAANALLQLRADRNDAQRMTRALRRAANKGLDGGLFKQLAASGDLTTAQQLARMSPGEIRRYERVFAERNKATVTLGRFAGQQVFGNQIRAQNTELKHLNTTLRQLEKRISRLGDDVRKGAQQGTHTGAAAGTQALGKRATLRTRS